MRIFQHAFTACSIIIGLAGCFFDPTTVEDSRQAAIEGLPILAALDQYQNEHGEYPKTLGELVPKYWDKSAFSKVGHLWYYNPKVGSTLYLAKKLGWDDSAEWKRNEGKQSIWWYDKGDGSGKGYEFKVDRDLR